MKIGILTSSRADFGIYKPLLDKLFADPFYKPEIIVFGTHLSSKFGYTIDEITSLGFCVKHTINTQAEDDTPISIADSIGKAISLFSSFWAEHSFDLVFALGDRYEMFAAVTAGSVFNMKFAHIHAGETTLGAIDNSFRHSISLMSKWLFTTTEEYKKRAIEIVQRPFDVFNVGALSIDNLKELKLYTKKEFFLKFGINLNTPTILTTFHPETISFDKNKVYIKELLSAIDELKHRYQVVITMPNADTMGLIIREAINEYVKDVDNVFIVESFGVLGYLSCMKYSSFLLGNSSSGFVEASFFPKWVINVGDRQEGRILTPNIFAIPVSKDEILKTVSEIEKTPLIGKINVYGDGRAADCIVDIVKKIANGHI